MGTPTSTKTYTYGDSQWGDLLTSYDGTAITYDTIGNMLDDGTWEYTWQHGRELEALFGEDVNGGANDVTVEYEYNANGLRISKTVTTNTYSSHTHSYTTTVIAPTCTEEGYTLHSCNECGDLYQDTILAALGHAFPDGSYACSRCGVAHPHSYTSTVVSNRPLSCRLYSIDVGL